MGITIDRGRAREVLEAAVAMAKTDAELPQEWVDRSLLVGEASSKTFTPMLGTALLARATDERIDPLSLKGTSGPRAYTPRVLAQHVLVPAAVEHRFDIRTTGPEPLNNQPFFRYDRVDEAERVRNPTELQYLVECLQQIDELTMDEATVALAAFVRVCLGRAGKRISASLESIAIGLRSCIEASRLLLAETAEGGKRAQALVAAAFDVVYGQDRVRTRLVNDPSRHFPGDVQALDAVGLPLISAEVRSKPVAELEIERFAQTLQNAQISRGLIAALATDQAPLANSPIVDRIASDLGVLVTVVDSVDELLTAAFGWSTGGLSDVLALFPQRVSERLRGIDADDDTVRRWTALLRHAQFEAERLKAT